MPMLLDLILVKHFRMRLDRKRRSAAALAIFIVMYKVYRPASFVLDQAMADEQGPWIYTNPVQEMRTGDKETVCFAGLAKG